MARDGPLTEEQFVRYQRDGYVVVEDLISSDEIDELRSRLREYTHGDREVSDPMWMQTEPRVERGDLSVDHPGDAIRKIVNLVESDDLFYDLVHDDRILGVAKQLLGPDLTLHGNMIFAKPPEVGSAKGVHQDAPYFDVRPMNLLNLWMPIDEATTENGCMVVDPGNFKDALPHVSVQDDYVVEEGYYDEDNFEPLPMKPGSGLFLHTLLPHYTVQNTTDQWRRALSFRIMSSRSRYMADGEESPDFFQLSGETFPGCVR